MSRKYNDYYDHENRIQHIPQIWNCPKCSMKAEVLYALEVTHKCPWNKSQLTSFKKSK